MSPHKSNPNHNRALALACAALALGAALGCEGDLLTAEERATLEGMRLAPAAAKPDQRRGGQRRRRPAGTQVLLRPALLRAAAGGFRSRHGRNRGQGGVGNGGLRDLPRPGAGRGRPAQPVGRQPGGRLDRAQQPDGDQRRPCALAVLGRPQGHVVEPGAGADREPGGAEHHPGARGPGDSQVLPAGLRGPVRAHARSERQPLPRGGAAGHGRLRRHVGGRQGGGEQGVRQLRQGHRGLRAAADRQVVAVRSLHGRGSRWP